MTLTYPIVVGVALLAFLLGSFAVVQYWLLAVVALASGKGAVRGPGREQRSFAILIPAHNEEVLIAKTVRSCMAIRYPKKKCKVYVIADNCTDRTADVAREHGAECLERSDPSHPGKGQAIGYALAQGIGESVDAVMILDADCEITTNALEAADRLLAQGEQVLQAKVTVGNPDDSAVSYMMAVGNHIENEFFYKGRSILGWIILLRGTGMVFGSEVLRRVPWRVVTVAEDAEFTILLQESGYAIRFMDEVVVRSVYPVSFEQMSVQRSRWSSGNASMARKHAVRSVLQGLHRRRWSQADLGQMLLVRSNPWVFACALSQFGLMVVADSMANGKTAPGLIAVSGGLVAALFAYFVLGILLFGLSWRRLGLLAMTPVALLRLSMISMRAILNPGDRVWRRTPRQG